MKDCSNQQIERVLATLSTEQRVAQTLHPFVRPQHSAGQVMEGFAGRLPGGVFVMGGTREETLRTTKLLQEHAEVPVVVSSDMECGPGRMLKDATTFPALMSLAAAGRKDLARMMGRAAAREGREVGLHWNFAPVVDINLSCHNPITNTRSLGDRTDTVRELAGEFIAGLQEEGMAACAKHFPGDGVDSRDQHVCTSVNPLDRETWRTCHGRVYRELFREGLMSVMIGHIALPTVDPGDGSSLSAAPPATLSRLLTTDLLRGELGFEGLAISDASVMGGLTSWGPRAQIIPAMMMAGCDQILFCDFPRDFELLMRALDEGRVTPERIDEAVRRVIRLKLRLGLFESTHGPAVPEPVRQTHLAASQRLAAEALTLVTDRHGAFPLRLRSGDKAYSLHLRADVQWHVDPVDDMLRDAGLMVTRCTEGEKPDSEAMREADIILVHVVYVPGWSTNRIRLCGNFLRDLVPALDFHDRRVVFISYGTPYLLNDLPRIPALLNAYSPDIVTQRAVVDLLLEGGIPKGASPVDLRLDPSWFAHRPPG